MPQASSKSVTKVFISYRREESSGYALNLCEKLSAHFGEDYIFMDIDIEPGADFINAIEDAVSSCDVLISLIGPRWLEISQGTMRRLDNPDDFVRREIAVALSRNVRVIPVLVQGASMSKEEHLPDELKMLSRRQALNGTDRHWRRDVDQLIRSIESESVQARETRFRVVLSCAIAIIVIGIIGVVVAKWKARLINTNNTSSNAAAAPSNSKQFTNSAGIEFIWIPPGQFIMGSERDDKKPSHLEKIDTGFYMGKYEVTQGQWEAVMGVKKNPSDPIYFYGCDRCPVEWVTWNDAMAFITKLNARHDGYIYELPSEAKWEYACRAGTTGDYTGVLDSVAWYGNNSGSEYLNASEIWQTDRNNYYDRINNNSGETHSVGTKDPNPFGLFDMQGNVWEWCADWGNANYEGAPLDGSAWLKGEQGTRVRRGGSWLGPAEFLSCSARVRDTAGRKENDIGFRLVAIPRQ